MRKPVRFAAIVALLCVACGNAVEPQIDGTYSLVIGGGWTRSMSKATAPELPSAARYG